MSIIFISHKLNEVLEIADRVTVLRRGKMIETLPTAGASEEELARRMVGRDVVLRIDKAPSEPAEPILVVEGLSVRDDRDLVKVHDVSFEVRGGEIVAIAGVDGNGQTELIDAITGLRRPSEGRIVVDGHGGHDRERPRSLRASASGTCPRTGSGAGLVLEFYARGEHRSSRLPHAPYSRFGWLFPKRLLERARRLIARVRRARR